MAKTKKTSEEIDVKSVVEVEPAQVPDVELEPGHLFSAPVPEVEIKNSLLFDLYVARVSKAETVETFRRDARAIFRDAFLEAKLALEVYLDQTTKGGQE